MDRQEKVATYYGTRIHAGYSFTCVKYLFDARPRRLRFKSLQSGQHSSFNSGYIQNKVFKGEEWYFRQEHFI